MVAIGHLEVVGLVPEVGPGLADVVGHARGAQAGTGPAPVERLLPGNLPDPLGAVAEDPVARDELLHVVDERRDALQQPAHGLDEVGRHVVGQPADPRVGDGQAAAGAGLQHGVDLLPRLVHVQKRRHRPDVVEVRADADDVVHDPGQLGEDQPDGLGARRRLDPCQLLHRQAVADAVDHRRAVVEAVGVRDDLVPGVPLRHLLEAAVQVADLHLGLGDDLAVEAHHRAKGAVGGGVRRADVEDLGLEVVVVLLGLARPGRLVLLALRGSSHR